MSEQSGGDPITREQVERLLVEVQSTTGLATAQVALGILGNGWLSVCPPYVAEFFDVRVTLPEAFRAALTRWRDELAAAEPVRRVARWSEADGLYRLDPPHEYSMAGGVTRAYLVARVQAIAWGYEIEGGPEPIQTLSRCPDCGGPRTDMDEHDAWCDDCWGKRCAAHYAATEPAEDSPERLRERREALGWHRARTADGLPLLWHDIERLETGRTDDDAADRALYAAALSAEEARRAKLAAERDAHAVPRLGWLEPERPVPRFKVGDWVRVVCNGTVYQVGEIATPFGGNAYYFRETGGAENSWQAAALEPASPPAPEVVDVPQPAPVLKTVAHFYTIRALPEPLRVSWNMPSDGPQWVRVDDGLWLHVDDLRAMLEDIDAQQGGAS